MASIKNTIPKSLNFGDSIELLFGKKVLHGEFIRMDKDESMLILKLKSGYDVGVPVKEMSSVKLIKRAEIEKRTQKKTDESSLHPHPNITMITTGGTISSKIDYKTGGVSPSVPAEYYLQIAPGLKTLGDVEIKDIMSIFSEDMKPSDWVKIAKTAYDAIKKGSKGVVVTMGTDTMHFASAAISFMLNPLSVPIVFTGAQRSTDRGSTDASTNLMLAGMAASKWDCGESVVCMHANLNDDYNFLIRGNRVRKMHSERRDAFRPVNSKPLARINLDGDITKLSDYRPKEKETVLNTKIDDKVAMLISYPGMKGDQIDYLVDKGLHGMVIQGTGFGNLPLAEKSLRSALLHANRKDIPIVITSQTIYGPTSTFVYSRLRELSKFGNIIYVGNMTSEAAFAKLIFALGQTKDLNKVKKLMVTQVAREKSEKDEAGEFLI